MELDRLKELTGKLPELTSLVLGRLDNVLSESKGFIIGIYLYKDEDVAVQRLFLTQDSVVAFPIHQEKEWLLLYKGILEITIGEESRILNAGGSIVIEPGTLHSVKAINDSWAIGVSIPAMKGYPNNGSK